jgi:DNA-binding NarL/FixJ family response regulator
MHHFHIADDHPLFRKALLEVLYQHFIDVTISESSDLDTTLKALTHHHDIDLLLLDLQMPGSHDLFGLINIREQFPTVPVAVISANESPAIINRAMAHGASGYIPKSASAKVLHKAIQTIIDGEHWLPPDVPTQILPINQEEKTLATKVASLTPQQYRVLQHLREGWLNKQIAFELGVTEATIKAHITVILRKLRVNNRTQAVIMLSQLGSNNSNSH